ncbi:MAG: hypothetical protein GF383_16530 [Candidatus Lokiarchaeota archaeon]|nr:hypothetical protein [Candidatus Lokiarchaeota archaeon]MBD3343390.1 hypothetical protein [Candidatus Lokiarchaeota archaeon]
MKFNKNKKIILLLSLLLGGILNSIGMINNYTPVYEEISEKAHKNEINMLNSAGFWTPNYIHIKSDNWSISGDAWIQVRSGTSIDPHIIENVTIDATGREWGITIEDSEDYFIIQNCTIYNAGTGSGSGALILKDTKNGQIIGNNISNNNENGIWLENYCENIEVSNNRVNLNGQNGIRLYESCIFNTISQNNLTYNSKWGLRFQYRCSNNTISNNNASNNTNNGFYIGDDCDDNLIEDNIANDNGIHGIRIDRKSDNNIIRNNIANSNDQTAILIQGVNSVGDDCYENQIIDNHLESNNYGIRVYGRIHNTTISRNTILYSEDHGIYSSNDCRYNIITKNTISYGVQNGVELAGFKNGTISLNKLVANHWDGLRITSNSGDNLIYGNLLKDNYERGVDIKSGAGIRNLVSMNSFINNTLGHGMDEKNPGDNDWDNGTYGNYWDNHTSPDNNNDLFVDNVYTWIQGAANSVDNHPLVNITSHLGEKIHIDETGMSAWNWSRTAEFKVWCSGSGTYINPYIIDGLEINGKTVGNGILIGNSSVYFTIQFCKVFKSGSGQTDAGIKFTETNNGMIINNNCSNNENHGILLYDECNNNTISGNLAFNNVDDGIHLYQSDENIITGNTLNENNQGLSIRYSDNNTISGNIANENLQGIYVYESVNSTLIGNTASGNTLLRGIILWQCDNNTISGNTANKNDDHGIYINNGEDNKILGNTVSFNGDAGIYLENSNYSSIHDNTAKNNTYGLHLEDSSYNCIYENIFVNNTYNYHETGTCIGNGDCRPGHSPAAEGGGGGGDDDAEEVIIPGYNIYILIGIICIVALVLIKKRWK